MRSHLLLSLALLSGSLLLLFSAPSARAQCGINTMGFGDVGVVSGYPFHAEITVTTASSADTMRKSALRSNNPQWLARDGLGRIRTERVTGEFQRDNGPEAGSKVQGRVIVICDPVAETMTQIDTLNLTAKIIHSRPSARSALAGTQRSICSARLLAGHPVGRFPVEDLGTRTTAGVEARGERVTMPRLGETAGEESPSGESTTERCCSDSLSAIVLTVYGNTKTGVKSTMAMRNIERSEPDPALFQIPPDCAITESVAEPRERQKPNALPNAQP